MIVGMSRVLVFGPKRLLSQVIEEVQRLGTVHIDRIEAKEAPAVQPLQLAEEDTKTVQVLERALARIDGLLGLLPPLASEPVPLPPDFSLDAIDAETTELDRRVRDLTRLRLELEEERQLIDSYEGAIRVLSPLLSALSGSQAFQTIGFLLNTKDLTAVAALRNELVKATDGRVEVVSRIVDDRRIGVVVAFLRPEAERVRAVLSRVGAAELRLPARFAQEGPAETIATMQRRKAEIPPEMERIDQELRALATSARPRLLALRAWLADRLAQLKVVPEMAQSHYTFILYGWAPTRVVPDVTRALHGRFSNDVVVSAEPVDVHMEPERVPVLLDNHPLIRPFQRLLALFQPPRYGTWDPSPVMAITFPIFVGLVIGDIGYGLLLFLLGRWLGSRARSGRALDIKFLSMRFQTPILADLSFLLQVLAFWIILFGVIYAEFFGNLPELLFHMTPLYDRVRESQNYFIVVIVAGTLMIFLGLLVHLVEAIRHKHASGIFESIILILGTAGLLLFLGGRGGQLPIQLAPVGLDLFLAAVGVALVSLIVDRDIMKRFLWLLESTSAFGHILSHARLMAFGLAAAELGIAANMLGPDMVREFAKVPFLGFLFIGIVGRILAILITIGAQTMFLVFTILGHILQPARLHWVEFFTKFKYHEQTGRAYRPFQKSAAPGR
jgi:V/A-type H+-transporting ATPase subunit I